MEIDLPGYNTLSRNPDSQLVRWLLEGDVSIQYQVYRDILDDHRPDLRKKITEEGWGSMYMAKRRPDGHWGLKFYQPKWTSSHYTLLDLRNMETDPGNSLIRESIDMIARNEKGHDGGINPSGTINNSDVCINGMFLNYACYFGVDPEPLKSVVDFILGQLMPDGGFNCQLNRSGAQHSSLHTTISALEGISEYIKNNYSYRADELLAAKESAREFVLMHRIFLSDRTGKVIKDAFLRIPYPPRWRYDYLRTLDYFRHSGEPCDERMTPAIDFLLKKQDSDGTWPLNAKYPGEEHFVMEKAGKRSRWNTLRALRVLKWWQESAGH